MIKLWGRHDNLSIYRLLNAEKRTIYRRLNAENKRKTTYPKKERKSEISILLEQRVESVIELKIYLFKGSIIRADRYVRFLKLVSGKGVVPLKLTLLCEIPL